MPLIDLGNRTWKLPHISGEDILLGSGKAGNFEPKLTLPCFLGESKLNFIPQVLALNAEVRGDELVAGNSNYQFKWKATSVNPLFNERGGMDIIITLNKKPPRNYIEFGYDATKLVAYHQPELTAKEIAEGCFRPDHVINSIAWYHNTKGGLVTPSDVKRFITTGKAFHTYRLLVTDALGNKTWADWTLELDNIVRLTVDQVFLNTCVYPVVIAPVGDTFGYTGFGGGGSAVGFYGPYRTILTTTKGGTVIDINAYVFNDPSNGNKYAKMAIYSGNNIISNGVSPQITVPEGTTGWVASTYVSSPTISAITPYGLALMMEDAYPYYTLQYYDSATGGVHGWDTTTYGTFPDPWSDDGSGTRRCSIYCEFTPSGGGLVEFCSDTEALSDSLIRRGRTNRFSAETITLGESSVRRLRSTRFVIETMSLIDLLIRRAYSNRFISETISIVDSFVKAFPGLPIVKILDETLSIGESLMRRLRGIYYTNNDESISDSPIRRGRVVKLFGETLTNIESVLRRGRIILLESTSESLSEIEIRRLRGIYALSEPETLTETSVRRGRSVRLLTEMQSLIDSLLYSMPGLRRILNWIVNLFSRDKTSSLRAYDIEADINERDITLTAQTEEQE